MGPRSPHILGIDDAPFDKHQTTPVPVVGVMMEGATLVEGVAIGAFPVDGADATGFLAEWVAGQRWHASLQAVIIGGITIAGLGLVDVPALSESVRVPVIAVTRQDTAGSTLSDALRKAGLQARLPILRRATAARPIDEGLYVSWAGGSFEEVARLVRASCAKARVPEPLRIAHLIGTALVSGASRGRV